MKHSKPVGSSGDLAIWPRCTGVFAQALTQTSRNASYKVMQEYLIWGLTEFSGAAQPQPGPPNKLVSHNSIIQSTLGLNSIPCKYTSHGFCAFFLSSSLVVGATGVSCLVTDRAKSWRVPEDKFEWSWGTSKRSSVTFNRPGLIDTVSAVATCQLSLSKGREERGEERGPDYWYFLQYLKLGVE